MADESKLIGIIGVDSDGAPEVREPIHISLSSYKGKKYLDVRKYYLAGDDWRPTKKGVTLNYDQIGDFVKLIQDSDSVIKKWFDEE